MPPRPSYDDIPGTDKLGVDTDDPSNHKLASARVCSICGQKPVVMGRVLSCPTHGTEGFEQRGLAATPDLSEITTHHRAFGPFSFGETMLLSIQDLISNPGALELLGTPQSLSTAYTEYLEHPYQPPRPPGIHASEIIKCKRQAVYSLSGTVAAPKPNARMNARFEIGSAVHEMVQRHFTYMSNTRKTAPKFRFEREVSTIKTPLGQRYIIDSRADGVYTLLDVEDKPFARVGLEIKTISSSDFAKLKAPEERHLDQATVYMACLDLPLMWFLYINKESGDRTPMVPPWLTVFDAARWARIRDRIESALNDWSSGVLPPKETGFHCTFCAYANTCEGLQQPSLDNDMG